MRVAPLLFAFALAFGSPPQVSRADEKDPPAAAPTVKEAGKEIWEDTKAAGRAIRDSKVGRAVAEAGKDVGHEATEVGKKVGAASVELGRETAEFSTKAWKKTSRASSRAATAVKNATVAFWSDLTRPREDEVGRLRKENEALKAKAREQGE